MNKIFTLSLATISFLFLSVGLKAQVYYNFTTAEPTTNSYSNIAADTIRQGNNNGTTPVRTPTSPSSGYTGASGGNNAGAAANTGGFTPLTSTYFETTLTPTGNNSVTLTGISFGSRSTGTGPTSISVRTSVDNFLADQATFTVAANSNYALVSGNLTVSALANIAVTIRIYGYNGTGNPGANTANWRIDDLTINPNATLPLNLTSFRGALNSNRSVSLVWNTTNEQGLRSITIERSNSGNFTPIATVAPQNSRQATYTFTDATPIVGTNSYRLKITNQDGTSRLSNVITINNSRGLSAKVFPNPVASNLSLTHDEAAKGATLRIVSLEGRQMKLVNVEQGAVQTGLGVDELSRGTYILIYDNAGEKFTTKFVKQ